MHTSTFVIKTWPEITKYMDLEGFDDNSYLINDENGIIEYGVDAYFINTEWLEKMEKFLKPIYVVTGVIEHTDESPTIFGKVFYDLKDAVSYKKDEIDEFFKYHDKSNGQVFTDIERIYEWRDSYGCQALTIVIEEQMLS